MANISYVRFCLAVFFTSFLISHPLSAQGPLAEVLGAAGVGNGSAIDLQVLNHGSTGGNDAVGLDLLNTEEGLAVTLFGDQLIGFSAGASISLQATGLDQLLRPLADDTLASSLRGVLGREGTITAPLVEVSTELARFLIEGGLDPLLAQGLPGLAEPAVSVAIAGGENSGVGDIAGISVMGGDNSGRGGVAGVALIGNSGAGSGTGGLIGVAVLTGDNSARGELLGAGVLTGDNSGQGGLLGAGVLSGANSGRSGGLGTAVLSDAGSGGGDSIGSVAVLTPGGPNGQGPINAGVLNPAGPGGASTDPDAGSELTRTGSRLALDELAVLCPGGDCQLVEGVPMILRGVNFEFDTARLTPESLPVLDRVAEIIKRDPHTLVSVDGHTDSVGTESYNQRLSERRARAVWRYLVEETGVDVSRVTYRGLGKTDPIAPNALEDGSDNPEGRELNRRVALNVVDATTFAQIEEVRQRQQQVGQL